jgi:uncharacterized protein (DUF952 family)
MTPPSPDEPILQNVPGSSPGESTGWLTHICPRADWEQAQAQGEYRPASLAGEGFIHCSTPQQVLDTANRYYHGARELVLLWIAPAHLSAKVRWEASVGKLFPHIYGPLNLEAVLAVTDFDADADGVFRTLRTP